MLDEITKEFDEEMLAELNRIRTELEGEERERALKNFSEVYAKRTTGESVEIQKEELELQEKNDKKNRRLNALKDFGLKTLEVLGTGVLVLICLSFEDEGAFTAQTTKNIVGKAFRK